MGGSSLRARGVAGFRPQRARSAALARRRCECGRRHPGAARANCADEQFDRVFNILHGGDGENGVLQGLLRDARRAVHRFGRARFRAEHGQDPHQAGVAVAGSVDAALPALAAGRRRACRGARARPAGDRQAVVRRFQRGRHRACSTMPASSGRRTGRALSGRIADGAADRRRRADRRHPRRHRACRRSASCRPASTTTTTPNTSPKTRSTCVPGLSGADEDEIRRLSFGRVRSRRLHRLGPRRCDARPQRPICTCSKSTPRRA